MATTGDAKHRFTLAQVGRMVTNEGESLFWRPGVTNTLTPGGLKDRIKKYNFYVV
jgi:hypothetical protein